MAIFVEKKVSGIISSMAAEDEIVLQCSTNDRKTSSAGMRSVHSFAVRSKKKINTRLFKAIDSDDSVKTFIVVTCIEG